MAKKKQKKTTAETDQVRHLKAILRISERAMLESSDGSSIQSLFLNQINRTSNEIRRLRGKKDSK
jgi:16S rRNA U1498 N3-methylase RsmE